jgi:hypothetical protein
LRVAQWSSSGLTGGEFARRAGVSEGSLRWWKWRLASEAGNGATKQPSAEVAPLTFVEMTSAVPHEPLEVVLTTGVRIRVPVDFDAGSIDRLLDVLERRR